jgi:hypothetical protein
VKFAYADPPYLGCCKRYDHFHPDGRCWDDLETHRLLIERLCTEFPEAWALSLSAPALKPILALCPGGVRVCPWVKPFASFKPGVNPGYCWEPVIFWGGRTAKERGGRTAPTIRDYHSANITLQKGLVGAKPPSFCAWLFDVFGARAGDEFHDIYAGTGGVSVAWEQFCAVQA